MKHEVQPTKHDVTVAVIIAVVWCMSLMIGAVIKADSKGMGWCGGATIASESSYLQQPSIFEGTLFRKEYNKQLKLQ